MTKQAKNSKKRKTAIPRANMWPKPLKVKPTKRKWKFLQYDTPEQIRMCLNCTLPDCTGWCQKMREAKIK